MWHTHILSSTRCYQADCMSITGFKHAPDHDDSVNDRSSPETKLNICTASTKDMWREAFGVEFAVEGGMYRGEPPVEYWSPDWVSAAVFLDPTVLPLPDPFAFTSLKRATQILTSFMLLTNSDLCHSGGTSQDTG